MSDAALQDQAGQVIETRAEAPRAARICQICGLTARVHILVGYESGKPKMNEFCISCATHRSHSREAAQTESRERIRFGSVLIIFGALLAVVGAFGALVGVSGHEGFGWYQRLGVGVGALVAICGALLRVELLALSGAIVAGLSAGVDFVSTQGSQSGEWLAFGLSCVGLFSMLAGLLVARRAVGPTSRKGAACNR
jgi:hypothetical protein